LTSGVADRVVLSAALTGRLGLGFGWLLVARLAWMRVGNHLLIEYRRIAAGPG
jgi:hypothetical protein